MELVLKAKYGDDWWTKAVPSNVRETADELKLQEQKDTFHGKRGRRDIDYLLLTQLWKIVNHKWKDFESLFPPGKHWVQSVIENDMNVSRRPIAHINPLEDDDIRNVETTFLKWVHPTSKPWPRSCPRRSARQRTAWGQHAPDDVVSWQLWTTTACEWSNPGAGAAPRVQSCRASSRWSPC